MCTNGLHMFLMLLYAWWLFCTLQFFFTPMFRRLYDGFNRIIY